MLSFTHCTLLRMQEITYQWEYPSTASVLAQIFVIKLKLEDKTQKTRKFRKN